MKRLRFSVGVAASIISCLLASAPAQADTAIQQPFKADSGDACLYGSTEGALTWRFGSFTSPLPVTAVDVKGTVRDRPLTGDPGFSCRDDGYFSTASFTAYSGSTIVAEKDAQADDATVAFTFTLAPTTTTRQIDRVVVRVCRNPLVTLPPSYCGKAVEYLAPPVAGL